MYEDKTESQLRAAGMLLVLECALNDLYPGRVTGTGNLWNRKITVWLNDLEDMVIDFSSEEGIRARISRSDKSSGSSDGDSRAPNTPVGEFHLVLDANLEAIQNFIQDLVIETASSVSVDPKNLVRKIADIAANTQRLKQALSNIESAPASSLFQPG
ncbi:MAG: hypothetical protein ACXW30_05150 [Micavibrio sp.]